MYRPTLPRRVGTAFEHYYATVTTPRILPTRQRVPRGFPLFWPRSYRLIDQNFFNSIDFLADEDVVDVTDETLGWE